jgi:M6 family metalloprotease-like protein
MTVVQSSLSKNMGSRPTRPGELLPSSIHLSHQDEDHRQRHLQRQLQSAANASVDLVQNITALVLLVQFPEDVNATLPSRDYFEALCHGDMAAYLRQQSYGQYHVQRCDVRDWRTAPYAASVYARGVANLRGPTASAELFRSILEQWWQWDSEYKGNSSRDDDDTILDWTIYDANRDGILDAVLVWHSGYGAEYADDDNECNVSRYYDRIHSQGHAHDNKTSSLVSSSLTSHHTTASSIRLSGYAIASAWDGLCTNRPAKMGVMTHEWLHILGARDVYGDIRGKGPQQSDGSGMTTTVGGLASFDIMSSPLGPTNTGIPASMSAYSKRAVGWLNYTEITSNDVYWLESSNRVPQAAVIRERYMAPFVYLLLEFRLATDYDANLFGGGLLMYHVDDRPRFKPDNTTTTVFAKHHRHIALLQADGRYDIEQGINFGDAGDFWRPSMVLRPSFGNETAVLPRPNTDSYDNGPTGIVIIVLSINDTYASFRVEGIGNDTGTNHSGATLASSTTLPLSAAPIEPSQSPPGIISRSPTAQNNEPLPSPSTPNINKCSNFTVKPSAMWSDFPSLLTSALPTRSAPATRIQQPPPMPKVAREFILPLSDSSLATTTRSIGISLASVTWLHLFYW